MKKTLFLCLSLMGMAANSFAQDDDVSMLPRQKRFEHRVGVQINELVRQVFNFNNSNTATPINNPYLLIYSFNAARSGWGARVGLGYTYRSFTDEDGVNRRETDNNVLQARLGAEKAFRLSNKWTAGVGIDGLYNMDNNYTRSVTRGFDTTTTVTDSDISSFGGGAMGWVRYNITDNIQLGTEASFYYVTGDQTQSISITRRVNSGIGGGSWSTTVTKVDNQVSEGLFRMPVALYLIIRF